MKAILIIIGLILFACFSLILFAAFRNAPTLEDDGEGGFWPYGEDI
ncbi:hypothetical protein RZS08_07850 [Arthrospira platensis SPKY1]|nr:hypothetical protein [Arthrospira platensis SPKY1]